MKITFNINEIENTENLAKVISQYSNKHDVILLEGDLGAGKTTFSKFFINHFSEIKHNVTSPTFNIVQTYKSNKCNIWHFDLYRLKNSLEIIEIGLEEALDEGLTIIEWFEIANDYLPEDYLEIKIDNSNDKRIATLFANGSWVKRLEKIQNKYQEDREKIIADFLHFNNLGNARVEKLKADASFRTYRRIYDSKKTLILMNAPPAYEDISKFILVDEYLRKQNLNAPEILGYNIKNGLMLLQDFGNNLFTTILNECSKQELCVKEKELYIKAVNVLDGLKKISDIGSKIPKYDDNLLLKEVKLLTDWYLPYKFDSEDHIQKESEYIEIWQELLKKINIFDNVFVHRDFHADNLLYLNDFDGIKQIGLLDFQDAVIGSPIYDLISLLEDARRDVLPQTVEECKKIFLKNNNFNINDFNMAYNIIAAQRNCKIIGIFIRLSVRDNKQNYLDYLPRVWNHLKNDLNHPDLKPLKDWFDKYVFKRI